MPAMIRVKDGAMPFPLPDPVADFISAANRLDLDALVGTFTHDALVNDKHRHFWGEDAIRRWAEAEMVGETVSIEVCETIEHYGDTIITARIGGGFDRARFDIFTINSATTVLHGPPADVLLAFYFTLHEGKIGQLLITPIDGSSPIATDETPFYIPFP
ncbi:MAG: hypothetical protein JWR80_7579 [Bradyrhizobium sp.]|nr:hypothetical protein [Bradyrhizobium sp.]